MKNATIKKAIEIGFDYEKSEFENRQEFEQEIMGFLNENQDELEKREDECDVTGHGNTQSVNYGNFTSSGEIINYDTDFFKLPANTKYFHSKFLDVDKKTGEPFQMCLYELVRKNDWND